MKFFIIGPLTVDQKILIHLSQLSWKESPRPIEAFNFIRPLKSKVVAQANSNPRGQYFAEPKNCE